MSQDARENVERHIETHPGRVDGCAACVVVTCYLAGHYYAFASDATSACIPCITTALAAARREHGDRCALTAEGQPAATAGDVGSTALRERLAAIQARVERATGGKWRVAVDTRQEHNGKKYGCEVVADLSPEEQQPWQRAGYVPLCELFYPNNPIRTGDPVDLIKAERAANAEFIAHARQDIPFLLAALAEEREAGALERAALRALWPALYEHFVEVEAGELDYYHFIELAVKAGLLAEEPYSVEKHADTSIAHGDDVEEGDPIYPPTALALSFRSRSEPEPQAP